MLGLLYRYGSEFDSELIYYTNPGVLFDEGDSVPFTDRISAISFNTVHTYIGDGIAQSV
jgi:hypothetical protein